MWAHRSAGRACSAPSQLWCLMLVTPSPSLSSSSSKPRLWPYTPDSRSAEQRKLTWSQCEGRKVPALVPSCPHADRHCCPPFSQEERPRVFTASFFTRHLNPTSSDLAGGFSSLDSLPGLYPGSSAFCVKTFSFLKATQFKSSRGW